MGLICPLLSLLCVVVVVPGLCFHGRIIQTRPTTARSQRRPCTGRQRRLQLCEEREEDYILSTSNVNIENDTSAKIQESDENGGWSDQLDERSSLFLLNFVAILWGTQHVCIKQSIDLYQSTSVLNFWRFTLSTLLFSGPIVTAFGNSRIDSSNIDSGNNLTEIGAPYDKGNFERTLKTGIELGLWTFLGFGFQAIGLETTTASRSAFLLYLNVKLVPLFALGFYGREISVQTWLSAASALFGTLLLSYDGSPPNTGDLWCIAAACASAMFILRLEDFAKESRAAEMNGITFATVAALCAGWILGDVYFSGGDMSIAELQKLVFEPFLSHPLPVVYLGLIATGICNFLQTLGQRVVAAERAAIVYSLDPVYGAFFSNVFLGETFGAQGIAGIAFVLLGVFISNNNPPAAENEKRVETNTATTNYS